MTQPTGPVSEHPVDDLAAYALDALDETERQAVDAHLAHCAECQGALAVHHGTLAALASDEAPPPAVWSRIAAGIGAADPAFSSTDTSPTDDPTSPAASAEVGPVSSGPPDAAGAGPSPGDPGADGDRFAAVSSFERAAHARARRSTPPRWLAAVAGMVAAAAVGGLLGFAVGDRRGADEADIARLAEQASQRPDGVLATLVDDSGETVARVVADEDGAYVQLEQLEDLPEGRAYQLWSLTGPEPVSLGMLGREGSNTVAFRLPPTITELAITEAPTSGDVAPNGGFRASGSIVRTS